MPYYSHQGQIYYVEAVSHAPNGYKVENVPERPAPPPVPPGPTSLDLYIEKLRRQTAEANLNYIRDKQRAEEQAQAARSATPAPQPKRAEVYVPKVIDPYCR
jgi:hypothetical protein